MTAEELKYNEKPDCRPEYCEYCYYHRKEPIIIDGKEVWCALLG